MSGLFDKKWSLGTQSLKRDISHVSNTVKSRNAKNQAKYKSKMKQKAIKKEKVHEGYVKARKKQYKDTEKEFTKRKGAVSKIHTGKGYSITKKNKPEPKVKGKGYHWTKNKYGDNVIVYD
jgi:hypothetical protein